MVITGILDTNVALYLLGGRLELPLPNGLYGISVITEMELLAWPSIGPGEEITIRAFLGSVVLCDLIPRVRQLAIEIRRTHRLRLPDSIIAATALACGSELWTNDAGFSRVSGLTCRTVQLRPT